MLRKETIDTLLSVTEPLVKCGVIGEDEMEELRSLVSESQVENAVEVPAHPLEDLQMLSLQKTARFLDKTIKGVYDLVNTGDLELIKLGHRTSRITCESIRHYVESHRRKRQEKPVSAVK